MARPKENKRERIIEAAVKVFAQKGFFYAKVSEIAKTAGVADGTIYLYFKNKDDILISLFEDRMSEFLTQCRQRIADIGNPFDKLTELIRFQLQLFELYPEMAEVITVELRQSTKFMREYRPRHFLDYLNLYGDIIREGQEQGLIAKEYTPALVKRLIFGAMDEVALAWALSGHRAYSLSQAAEEIATLLRRGLAPPMPARR